MSLSLAVVSTVVALDNSLSLLCWLGEYGWQRLMLILPVHFRAVPSSPGGAASEDQLSPVWTHDSVLHDHLGLRGLLCRGECQLLLSELLFNCSLDDGIRHKRNWGSWRASRHGLMLLFHWGLHDMNTGCIQQLWPRVVDALSSWCRHHVLIYLRYHTTPTHVWRLIVVLLWIQVLLLGCHLLQTDQLLNCSLWIWSRCDELDMRDGSFNLLLEEWLFEYLNYALFLECEALVLRLSNQIKGA